MKKKLSALIVAMIIAVTMIISVPLAASAKEDGRYKSLKNNSKKHCRWIPGHKEYVNHDLNHHKYWVPGHRSCDRHEYEDHSNWASWKKR